MRIEMNIIDENNGLVTITRHEYLYLDARDAFLETVLKVDPEWVDGWLNFYEEYIE